MSRKQQPPAEVMSALETLENAQSPADLGAPYQVVLNWRRRHALPSLPRFLSTTLIGVGVIAVAALGVLMARFITPENQEFWRGVQVGVMVSAVATWIAHWINPTPQPPRTVSQRMEDALSRWRHLTPRMREIPQ